MKPPILRAAILTAVVGFVVSGCERPPTDVVQHGYRGTGMDEIYNPRTVAKLETANVVPAASPLAPAGGPPATAVYKNIQVLTDLNAAELARLMVAITAWVAPPDQSCAYCHNGADMANDDNYRKVVARTMLRMTRHLNAEWKTHVASTGVTCYTCHRGNGVPTYVWYQQPGPAYTPEFAGSHPGQNAPSPMVGLASLPNDAFSVYLDDKPTNIRVVATEALPERSGAPISEGAPIKSAEQTYGLMMHISTALGVNCTYCHNTRSFTSWDSSTPQRTTAWYGIRMVRDVNAHYLESLTATFPDDRKGPMGDVAKVNCETCHQGVYKPLFGVSMLKDYPELSGAVPAETPATAPSSGAAQ